MTRFKKSRSSNIPHKHSKKYFCYITSTCHQNYLQRWDLQLLTSVCWTLGLAMKVMWRNAMRTAYWLCCCWGSHTFCNLTTIHWINHMWEFELYNTTNTTELKYLKSLLISASEAGFPSLLIWWGSAIWVKEGQHAADNTPAPPPLRKPEKSVINTYCFCSLWCRNYL